MKDLAKLIKTSKFKTHKKLATFDQVEQPKKHNFIFLKKILQHFDFKALIISNKEQKMH